MIWAWAIAAFAAPGDVAVTSLGGQGVYDQGLALGDADVLVGERLRWTFLEGQTTALALADARFTLDPVVGDEGDVWEQNRVRSLGVEVLAQGWVVDVGRHPVYRGGPRIVDGVQVLRRSGPWVVGGWGGLAPDLFTTRPMLRGGGGPVVAYEQSKVQASLVGEVLAAAGGLDRAGLLAAGRYAPDRRLDLTGRLDLQLADEAGRIGLADGALTAKVRPDRSWTFDALYDAYTTLRYLETWQLDPDVRRFDTRVIDLGLAPGIVEELLDPGLFQLVGGGIAWQHAATVMPRVAVVGRYRHHADLEDRYARVGPVAGVMGLAGERLDLFADYAWVWHGATGARQEVGLNVVVDPLASGAFVVDASGRMLVDPAFEGRPGWYGDLFVDLLAAGSVVVVGGASATNEPAVVPDMGLAGFLRVQHTLKPRREEQAAW